MASSIETSRPKATGLSMRLAFVVLVPLLLLGGGYGAWWYFGVPSLSKYQPVLAMMAAHQLKTDELGRVMLDKTFPGLTPRDQAYVNYRDDGTFIAMFPTYYGEGPQIAGLIYSSRPLRDSDTRIRLSSALADERLIAVGGYGSLVLEKQINPNWYHASYHLR